MGAHSVIPANAGIQAAPRAARSWGIAALAALVAVSNQARAQELVLPPKLPMRWAERPLTLPKHTLRFATSLLIEHDEHTFPPDPSGAAGLTESRLDVGGALAAALGITDDVEIGMQPIRVLAQRRTAHLSCPVLVTGPIPCADTATATTPYYANPSLYARWRYFHRPIAELGLALDLSIPVAKDRDFGAVLGFPVRVHLARRVRIDTGLRFGLRVPIASADGSSVRPSAGFSGFAPGLPLAVSVSATRWFFAGVASGFGIDDFHHAAATAFLPLGVHLGATIPLHGEPLVDLLLLGGFPKLLTPGADPTTSRTTHPEHQTAGFTARFHVFL